MADSIRMTSLRLWLNRACHTSLLAAAFVSVASLSPRAAEPEPMTGLARLKAGNERFVKGISATVPFGAATRQALTTGEHPFAMVLSCSDSRVPPEFVFNTGLGDLYVVRAAGPVADKSVMASLEFGAEQLHIPLLVVMGHESCSVVKSAVDTEHGDGPNLDYLVGHIRAGLKHTAAEQQSLRSAVLANVEQVLNDAMSGSAILRRAAAAGRLQIVGAYYEQATGAVTFSSPVGSPSDATPAAAAAGHK